MKNFLKLCAIVLMFGGLALAGMGLMQEDVKPTLQVGNMFVVGALAAALLLGPGIGILGGMLGRRVLRQDFEQMRRMPVPGRYRMIANLVMNYPFFYYLFLSAVCAGALGGGAWGLLTGWERNHAKAQGNVSCSVVAMRRIAQTPRVEITLQCPSSQQKPKTLKLRAEGVPVSAPSDLVVPSSKGVLGTVFLDGSKLAF